MTEPTEPTRLRDLDPLLREAFEQVQSSRPSPARVDAIARAVELATSQAGAAGTSALTAGTGEVVLFHSGLVKFAVIGVVSTALWWAVTSAGPKPSGPKPGDRRVVGETSSVAAPIEARGAESASASRAPRPSESRLSQSGQAPTQVAGSSPGHATDTLPGRRRSTHTPPSVRDARSGSIARVAPTRRSRSAAGTIEKAGRSEHGRERELSPTVAPNSELALLEQAQYALLASPAQALALTEQHEREYKAGVYVQEREQIAIEALFGMGRMATMQERVARFRLTFPSSPHLPRMKQLAEARGP